MKVRTMIVGLAIVLILGIFVYKTYLLQKSKPIDPGLVIIPKITPTDSHNPPIMGVVLAGKGGSSYYTFQKDGYEAARKANKIIYLDFYANWCPICRGEEPDILKGFDQLNNKNIVGFRVNYNDSETDEYEKDLAKKFGVTYQHTKVVLKDGKQILKTGEVWDTGTFLKTLNTITQ